MYRHCRTSLFQIPTVSKYTKVLQIRVDCTVIYTAAGLNSSFSVTNIPTATGHDLLQLLDPLLKLLCFPLDYFVVQTLDQDIVECVRDYGLWAEQLALADIVNAEDTGNPLKVSETYRPHCMQVKPLTDTVVDVIVFASTADHQCSLAAQIGRRP